MSALTMSENTTEVYAAAVDAMSAQPSRHLLLEMQYSAEIGGTRTTHSDVINFVAFASNISSANTRLFVTTCSICNV